MEPFRRLTCPGQVLLHGKAMSKSLGNLVSLREQLDLHGPDAVRVAILFAGRPEHDKDWAEVNPGAAVKWLDRVRRLRDVSPTGEDAGPGVARLIAAVTEAMEHKRFNVAIARLMELTTLLRRSPTRAGIDALRTMLSCFAPITAGRAGDAWPAVSFREATATCVIQVDGKVRARLEVPASIAADELEALARHKIGGVAAKRVIVRAPRLVNYVT